MSLKIKFSALGSVYGEEKAEYLNEALSSLHKQTLLSSEVVLVQDGLLTEELYSCIEKWRKLLPLKDVKLEEHKGLGAALNAGLAKCSYEWIARFDSDDINDANRFAIQFEYLKNNPEISVISSTFREFCNSPNDRDRVRDLPTDHESIVQYAAKRSPLNHTSAVFKKSDVLSVGGYPTDVLYMEDYVLWLKMIAKGYKLSNITKVLVHVRSKDDRMIKRRMGLTYAKSEIKICRLKYKLGINNSVSMWGILIARLLLRFLPIKVLSFLYAKFLRTSA